MFTLEGSSADHANTGEGTAQRTGLGIVARLEEDAPGTWEALTTPWQSVVGRSQGATGAATDGGEGVGGPHTSVEVGERKAPGPGGAKAVRVGVNFRGEPCLMHRHRSACHRDFER